MIKLKEIIKLGKNEITCREGITYRCVKFALKSMLKKWKKYPKSYHSVHEDEFCKITIQIKEGDSDG